MPYFVLSLCGTYLNVTSIVLVRVATVNDVSLHFRKFII